MWPFKRKPDPFDQILKANFDGDFSVFACGNDAPGEHVIADFEKSIGFRLPADFRKFSISKLGGVYIEVKEAVWPRTKEFEVGPFWSFLYGLFVHGFSKEVPEWMDIRVQTEKFRAETKTPHVPCLKILANADVYCFDRDGKLRQWDHETGEAPVQERDFTQLFAFEVAELRKRKDRKIAERQKDAGKA